METSLFFSRQKNRDGSGRQEKVSIHTFPQTASPDTQAGAKFGAVIRRRAEADCFGWHFFGSLRFSCKEMELL